MLAWTVDIPGLKPSACAISYLLLGAVATAIAGTG